ncbi:hypothetical protein GGR26_002434 [Lewinella marina]|uniref:O-antigen polymerase n=1 Tax=Neolewinella marina TaxID=438751 RepID=A0A2G0CBW9_9BACT|nr:hypothetical protein [Neolewinella marina]NJB86657.1 hypothetical protein [Neolewinella marina]PHK97465.1 hypothetical protein CGL56_15310 [Neolewinella marina]
MKPFLLPLFAVATLFPRLLSFPSPWEQVQLTELLFFPLLWLFRKELFDSVRRLPAFSSAAGLYVVIGVISGFASGEMGAVLEAGSRGYLAALALLTVAHLYRYGPGQLEAWWKWGTVITAAAALAYYALIMVGVPDQLNWVERFSDYPYLGEVYRMRATGNTYGMWMMLTLPGLLIALGDWHRGRGRLWPVGLILMAMLPTLSKELLLVLTGFLLLSNSPAAVRVGGSVLLGIVLVLGTHYLVVDSESGHHPTSYLGNSTLVSVGDYHLVESVYLPIKRAALRVGQQHPWLGVGPGQFATFSQGAVPPGELPPAFGPFDPHSVWTGTIAETGILGLLTLITLVAVLFAYWPKQITVVGALLILFLISSVFKDVLNFRGLWVLIGWFLAQGAGVSHAKEGATSERGRVSLA